MTGCERLKTMIEGPFQKPLFKIYMYLKSRPDMDDKYLNPEKSMKQMYEYIKSQVKKQAVNGVAMIEDSVVYGLAIHYFDESNEDLGIKKEEIKPKKIEDSKPAVKEIEEPEKEEKEQQLTLFGGGK